MSSTITAANLDQKTITSSISRIFFVIYRIYHILLYLLYYLIYFFKRIYIIYNYFTVISFDTFKMNLLSRYCWRLWANVIGNCSKLYLNQRWTLIRQLHLPLVVYFLNVFYIYYILLYLLYYLLYFFKRIYIIYNYFTVISFNTFKMKRSGNKLIKRKREYIVRRKHNRRRKTHYEFKKCDAGLCADSCFKLRHALLDF